MWPLEPDEFESLVQIPADHQRDEAWFFVMIDGQMVCVSEQGIPRPVTGDELRPRWKVHDGWSSPLAKKNLWEAGVTPPNVPLLARETLALGYLNCLYDDRLCRPVPISGDC